MGLMSLTFCNPAVAGTVCQKDVISRKSGSQESGSGPVGRLCRASWSSGDGQLAGRGAGSVVL